MKIIKYERPEVPVVVPRITAIEENGFIRFRKMNFFEEIIWMIKFRIRLRKLKKSGIDIEQLNIGDMFKWNF